MIYGSVFGGGRAADVTGKTEVVIVNCDSIGAIYGGNDIAGTAGGAEGSVITLGVGTTGTGDGNTIKPIRIGSVYGGGNGYYAYGSQAFAPATSGTSTIASGDVVYAQSQSNQWDDPVWTNTGTTEVSKPTLVKTSITVTNDFVKVDSIFGGAKNAFVTKNKTSENDVTTVNTLTTINGGTIFAVFGGNNVGGTLGTARQKVDVTATTQDLDPDTGTTDLGRTHGIGYLFGGGNMVAGTTTEVNIFGGQLDTIFGGGNRESVDAAWLTVNCAGDKRISSALDGSGNILSSYGWDGDALYNVHTLFGGNNRAHMNGVPHITLISGGVGTAYGGGNAGDMLAHVSTTLDGTSVNYGTHMVLSENNMIVDFLYGGCQMSNVEYSTWVEIQGGHVGTVYGGCNVSGDVGSIRTDPTAPAFNGTGSSQTANPEYQKVKGATYVKVTGGTVYRDVFAGSNGYYHCNDGVYYVAGMNYGDPDDGHPEAYDPDGLYVGLRVPTHNETNVKIQGGLIKGNVYAGGNLACVGFTDYTVPQDLPTGVAYPQFVGLSFVEMSAGHVMGDVYGGGRMASVFGSNSVKVSGGTIDGALYGGNDRTGQVAQITNRVLPDSYGKASDNVTDLNQLNVKTYVRVTGAPTVGTVYGGGNGDYNYTGIGEDAIQFCGITPDEPIQSNTFVDIDIDGGGDGNPAGYIGTVYGGGNGVTVINGITVMLNVKNPDYTASTDHVGTIFGGNNKGSLTLIPDIILLKGKVNTVYGGCNKGAMYGDYTVSTGDSTYHNVGSLVRLRNEYRPNGTGSPITPTAQVTGAVYGGCRMNGVTTNSMVLVEGHDNDHVNAELFGGSDISGVVGGTSMVVINGVNTTSGELFATQVGDVYGGGNGHYKYQNNNVYVLNDDGTTGALIDEGTSQNPIQAPYCKESRVDMLNGNCASGHNLYAGGYAALSGATEMNVVGGTVNDRVFGGGNLAGTTTASYTFENTSYSGDGTSTVNVTAGLVKGGVYGGNNLEGTIVDDINVNILGGTFGTSTSTPMTDGIFGGGYGNQTRTTGNVMVTVNKQSGADAPVIYGDVYGGSGYGDVNTAAEDVSATDPADTTMVNILEGTIYGDVYGGGLGDKAVEGDNSHHDYPAHVNGKVYVNVGDGEVDATTGCATNLSGNATIEGSVYGCNNINGTPLDSVFVNIYKTAHVTANQYPATPSGGWSLSTLTANDNPSNYALSAVYGGGNKAAYLPPLNDNDTPKCATVHVWGCQENTIYDVYGGGNAADVGVENGTAANTQVIIDGGRIHRMFGGGNGYSSTGNHSDPSDPNNYNPGANIYGTASSYVYAGLIDEVYGGANQWGSIDNIDLHVLSTECCDDAVYRKVFGCANEAPINHSIVTTIGCGVGEIGELYGGSNLASIGVNDQTQPKANVTLNLYGGDYQKVFGGSKGRLAGNGETAVSADIYGDVTLNLYGGTVIDAFGGSDQLGSIKGTITVNVLDDENCGLDLTNVYGASNLADYDPWTVDGEMVQSPIVNVMHIYNVEGSDMKGIRGNVYGGGYQASVNAKPIVNIGYEAGTVVYGTTTMADLIPDDYPDFDDLTDFPMAYITGDVFGGGDLADVTGKTTVNMRQSQSRLTNIFGGGNEAGVGGSEVNVYNGTVATAVYGGCNTKGNVNGDIAVNVLGGTLGTSSTNTIGIFGGGYGGPDPANSNPGTTSNGDVTVTIGGAGYNPTIYGTVYGGSALGSVSAANKLTMVWLKSGTVNGNVFGGGLGQLANSQASPAVPAIAAHVNGNIEVIGDGTDVNGWVFGANDQNGDPEGTVTVTINDGTINNVVGGGNVANYTAPSGSGSTILYSPYVLITGGTVTDMVVGGGNMANIDGNTKVELTGGTIGSENHEAHIFGGGYGQDTQVTGDVEVNFGAITRNDAGEETHNPNLMLYGDLYGGSALGDVNTNSSNNTTVNILNGTIVGAVYGGGLGQKEGVNGATSDIAATVNGDVQVNIGACNGSGCKDDTYNSNAAAGYTGMADLILCDVYGCNNVNGSPLDAVRVDVYKTYHGTEQSNPNGPYAINQVFGGGNESDYDYVNHHLPVNVRIHGCDNTIWRTFGGGNAAAVYGVVLVIEGGSFDQVFGGGNGERGAAYAANIVGGGIHTTLGGGTINQWVNGSNENGEITGNIVSVVEQYCGNALVEDYFLGSNLTDYHGDVTTTILCDENMPQFVNLYGGCNRAQFYGNISITIRGGVFFNVFGGSKGRLDDPETDEDESFASNILDYTNGNGTGGNITILVEGGHIGNLYGGCNLNGNVQGKIKIDVVQDVNIVDCPLYLGNIYGGGNMTDYKPGYDKDGNFVQSYGYLTDPTNTNFVNTPEINVKKGTVGGTQTVLIDPNTQQPYIYEGNVYGGGHKGDVKAYPIVNIGDKDHPTTSPVTIEGNVYGGGREGKVIGDTKVIIVPTNN